MYLMKACEKDRQARTTFVYRASQLYKLTSRSGPLPRASKVPPLSLRVLKEI